MHLVPLGEIHLCRALLDLTGAFAVLVLAHVMRKDHVLRVAGEFLCYTPCEWYTTSYSDVLSPSTGADVGVFVPLPSPQSIHRKNIFQHVGFLIFCEGRTSCHEPACTERMLIMMRVVCRAGVPTIVLLP